MKETEGTQAGGATRLVLFLSANLKTRCIQTRTHP